MASKRITCAVCAGLGYQMIRHSNTHLKDQEHLMKQFCTTCNGTGSIKVQETNGDRIRSMTDKQMVHFIHELVSSDYFCRICPKYGKCVELLNTDGDIPGIWCEETIQG